MSSRDRVFVVRVVPMAGLINNDPAINRASGKQRDDQQRASVSFHTHSYLNLSGRAHDTRHW